MGVFVPSNNNKLTPGSISEFLPIVCSDMQVSLSYLLYHGMYSLTFTSDARHRSNVPLKSDNVATPHMKIIDPMKSGVIKVSARSSTFAMNPASKS